MNDGKRHHINESFSLFPIFWAPRQSLSARYRPAPGQARIFGGLTVEKFVILVRCLVRMVEHLKFSLRE